MLPSECNQNADVALGEIEFDAPALEQQKHSSRRNLEQILHVRI